jgi:LPXTG-site transpeptidase (sortase) family protein
VPQSLSLAGGATAEVFPAATVDGELKVPERVSHVGWWDGSAYAGDPFGTTVVAGHVDSATEGMGFFAKLLRSKVNDEVLLRGDGHQATYRVVSVQLVAKRALSSDSRAFDQTGDHRLVLITCAGRYDASRGGYDSNLVVTAVPVGPVR